MDPLAMRDLERVRGQSLEDWLNAAPNPVLVRARSPDAREVPAAALDGSDQLVLFEVSCPEWKFAVGRSGDTYSKSWTCGS